jgi:hypothetical protein
VTRFLLALGLITAGLGPATAQEVGECDWRASLAAIPTPWEDHTRLFANGAVRVTLTDAIEPGAGPLFLVILSPPFDELGSQQCRVIGMGAGMGFGGIGFAEIAASYDPATGLALAVPVSIYDDAKGNFVARTLGLTLNQSTGQIGAQLE